MDQGSCLAPLPIQSLRPQAQSSLLKIQAPASLQCKASSHGPRLFACPGAGLGSMDTDSRLIPIDSGSWLAPASRLAPEDPGTWPAPVSGYTSRTQPSGQHLYPKAIGQLLWHQNPGPPPALQGPGPPHGPKCQPTSVDPSTSPAQPLTQAPDLPT